MTAENRYMPSWDSIKSHPLPDWYDDCKLGIFIHWGLYSVPAWAEVTWELGGHPSPQAWFTHNPYAEWYQNTIRIDGSPAQRHHAATYGKDYPYERFADAFTCESWDPAGWAALFRQAGAGYVVLTSKHHDGFCLYPSRYTDYTSAHHGPKRDIAGELTDAVRKDGMRMGLYYSGLLDWTTHPYPKLGFDLEMDYNPTYAFSDYSFNQAMELVDRYRPSLLWNDISWPEKGQRDLPRLLAHYYNTVPDGVVNDRFNCGWCDHTTAEYQTGDRSLDKKWEYCRGLGLSFGYNQNEGAETVLSGPALVQLLAEVVSEGGNLLINIGPKADGTIPEIQADRLWALGRWMDTHGEAIRGTRPWRRCQNEPLENDTMAYYTRKGNTLYVILSGLAAGTHTLALPAAGKTVTVSAGDNYPVHLEMEGNWDV